MGSLAERLRILSWEGFVPDWFVEGFLEETGIRLEVEYAGTNDEVIERLAPAGKSGFDLTTVDHHASVELVDKGLLEALVVHDLPAFTTNFEAFRHTWYTDIDGQIWGLPFAWGSMALVYDPSKVSAEEAASWNCMWEERLQGQLAQYDSPIEAIFGAALLKGYSNVFDLDAEQLAACKELLIEQKRLLKGTYDSVEALADWIEEGSVAIAHTWMATVTELARRGVTVGVSIPEAGCLAGVLLYHIAKGTPRFTEVYQFINYATRPDVCARLCIDISNSPCNAEVVEQLDVEWKARLSTDPQDIERFTLYHPVENYKQYQKVWEEVKALK
jgi:putative spermidine/putrescine transport system substrate-binding protein/spermidine/putrescine transport system substrate-binding protein